MENNHTISPMEGEVKPRLCCVDEENKSEEVITEADEGLKSESIQTAEDLQGTTNDIYQQIFSSFANQIIQAFINQHKQKLRGNNMGIQDRRNIQTQLHCKNPLLQTLSQVHKQRRIQVDCYQKLINQVMTEIQTDMKELKVVQKILTEKIRIKFSSSTMDTLREMMKMPSQRKEEQPYEEPPIYFWAFSPDASPNDKSVYELPMIDLHSYFELREKVELTRDIFMAKLLDDIFAPQKLPINSHIDDQPHPFFISRKNDSTNFMRRFLHVDRQEQYVCANIIQDQQLVQPKKPLNYVIVESCPAKKIPQQTYKVIIES